YPWKGTPSAISLACKEKGGPCGPPSKSVYPKGSGDCAADPGRQGSLRCSANFHVGNFAVLEQHQGRNGAHAILGGKLGVLINVDLGHFDLAGKLGCDFLQRRSNHLARTAPFGPEVDDDRLGSLKNVGLEIVLVDGDGGHGESP